MSLEIEGITRFTSITHLRCIIAEASQILLLEASSRMMDCPKPRCFESEPYNNSIEMKLYSFTFLLQDWFQGCESIEGNVHFLNCTNVLAVSNQRTEDHYKVWQFLTSFSRLLANFFWKITKEKNEMRTNRHPKCISSNLSFRDHQGRYPKARSFLSSGSRRYCL